MNRIETRFILPLFFITGLSLTYWTYQKESQGHLDQQKESFIKDSKERAIHITQNIENKKKSLDLLEGFFASSNHISENEFKKFSLFFNRTLSVSAICWSHSDSESIYSYGDSQLCKKVNFLSEEHFFSKDTDYYYAVNRFVTSESGKKGFVSVVLPLIETFDSASGGRFQEFILINFQDTNQALSFSNSKEGLKTKDIRDFKDDYLESYTAALNNTSEARFYYKSFYTRENFESSRTLSLLSVPFITLFLTIILVIYLKSLFSQKERVSNLVEIRTKELQEEVVTRKEAQKKAEAYSQTKTQFLANMSHEIRTPMNGVLGMLELLKETQLNNEQGEIVQVVETSTNNLMLILNDVLDFSKIESGRVSAEKRFFCLEKLISDSISLFEGNAKTKGISLNVDAQIDQNVLIYQDDFKVKQILMNLIGNAVKFTEEGSVNLKVDYNDEEVAFIVSDSGIGIKSEDLDLLFKSFSQVDGSIARKFGGTGLGLSISYSLAKLLGGSIDVKSEFSKGSEFTVKFPIQVKRDTETKPKADSSKDKPVLIKSDLKILVAEDNLINQKVAKAMLKKIGCQVEFAANGLEALELIRKNRYDVVFMDIQMPVLNGYEATEAIIKELKEEAPPIYAMTANISEDDRRESFKVGMIGFVEKPIKKKKIQEILSSYS